MLRLFLLNMSDRGFAANLRSVSLCSGYDKPVIKKAYSGEAMAVCVSDQAGFAIDIEEKRHRSEETISYFFGKFRSFGTRHNGPDTGLDLFYRGWTAMESYFKLTGRGFNAPKDFFLDIENKTVYRNENEVARFDFYHAGNYIICLCGDAGFPETDIAFSGCGWGTRNG